MCSFGATITFTCYSQRWSGGRDGKEGRGQGDKEGCGVYKGRELEGDQEEMVLS